MVRKTPDHWRDRVNITPRLMEFDNPTEAFRGILDAMVDGTLTPNHWGGPRSNFSGMTFIIHHPEKNPINMVEAGFRLPQRWSKFLKDYCDLPTYRGFIGNIWSSQPGQSITYYTVPVAGHSLGNCVQSINFLGHKPYRMQMTNRTAQISPIGCLDITFLCETARIASEMLQLDYVMPAIWNCHSIQCHVVEAAHIYAYRNQLDWVQELAEKEVGWTAREVWANVAKATSHKQTAWRTFERAWKKTRDRIERHQKGTIDKLGTYYGTVPTHFWNFMAEGHSNSEGLEEELGVSRTWLRHRIRPFRAMLNHRWGIPLINSYDLVWPDDHPELLVIKYVYKYGGSVDSLNDLCKALDVETEQEAKDYVMPYYAAYRG